MRSVPVVMRWAGRPLAAVALVAVAVAGVPAGAAAHETSEVTGNALGYQQCEAPAADELRATRLLDQMDRLNMYRIAAEKAPFAIPVKNAYRFTSGYGNRRDPKTGGRRMHKGTDFAAPLGTPIYATADGVVTHAGWSSGFGKMVKIQHDFGIVTLYAHQSKLRVKVGQRVSRGDRIGDMGTTVVSTGVHLHYEVRAGGKAVNPMTYIKAANNVF